MNKGITDYIGILKDPIAKSFLNITNIKQISNNYFQYFCDTNTLDNILQTLFNKYDNEYLTLCPFPVYNWLHLQDIDFNNFDISVIELILQMTKQKWFRFPMSS